MAVIKSSPVSSSPQSYNSELKKASNKRSRRVEQLLEAIEILGFKPPADIHYGEIRNQLQKVGTPIEPNDLLIAAHALSENLSMYLICLLKIGCGKFIQIHLNSHDKLIIVT